MENVITFDEGHDQEFSELAIKFIEEQYRSIIIGDPLIGTKPFQDFSSYLRSPETYDECLGDFDKKVVGKHCYPHWHKQER